MPEKKYNEVFSEVDCTVADLSLLEQSLRLLSQRFCLKDDFETITGIIELLNSIRSRLLYSNVVPF